MSLVRVYSEKARNLNNQIRLWDSMILHDYTILTWTRPDYRKIGTPFEGHTAEQRLIIIKTFSITKVKKEKIEE